MASAMRRRWFAALAQVGLRRPWRVILGVLLVVASAGAVVPGLGVTTSRHGLVSQENPYQRRLLTFLERFGQPDAPLILVRGATPERRRAAADALGAGLEARWPGRVLWRADPELFAEAMFLDDPGRLGAAGQWDGIARGGVAGLLGSVTQGVYAGLDGEVEVQPQQGPEALTPMLHALAKELRGESSEGLLGVGRPQEARDNLDEAGYFTAADRSAVVVAVFVDFSGDEVGEFQPVVAAMRKIRDDVIAEHPGVTVAVSGLPALIVDEMHTIRGDLARTSVATGLGLVLLLWLLFRTLRQTVIALVPLGCGLVVALAAAELLFDNLNLITSSFAALLLGLGVDFSVHALARYNETRRTGAPVVDAVQDALVHAGPGIMTGALTTALAFLATSLTDFTAYAELGVITAIGLAAMVAFTLLLVPPLLRLGGRGADAAPEPRFVGGLVGVARRGRWAVLGIGVTIAIVALAMAPSIRFDYRYFRFLPESTESATALEALEFDPYYSPLFVNITASDLDSARDMAERLRAMPEVAGVQSATDVLPALTPKRLAALREQFGEAVSFDQFAANSNPAALAKAARDLRGALQEARFAAVAVDRAAAPFDEAIAAAGALAKAASQEGAAPRLRTLEGELGSILGRAYGTAHRVAERGHYTLADLPPLIRSRYGARVGEAVALFAIPAGNLWDNDVIDKFRVAVERVDPNVAGLALSLRAHGSMIVRGFVDAAGWAALAIFFVLLWDFRSPKMAALALVPTGIGWAWMLGVMVLVDHPFDMANIICLPLVLGIGIDAGVHLMHRVQECRARDGGPAPLEEVVGGTGGAIVLASATTMLGFGGLFAASYGGMHSLAFVMVTGIFACLVASVVLLPALLVVVGLAR